MKFEKQLLSLVTAGLLCGTFTTPSGAQQTAGSEAVAPAPAATPTTVTSPVPMISAADAALIKSTPPLTEDALRARYVGKLIFLRGSYLGDDLNFDQDGRVNGAPTVRSFTLFGFEARQVNLSQR